LTHALVRELLVLFCIELSNVVMFALKAIRLLRALDDMSKDEEGRELSVSVLFLF
jgi:hypothetical protein